MSNDTVEKKRAALLERLGELTLDERLLLHVLAVAAEPLANDMVLLLLARIRLSDADAATEAPTLLTLKPILRRLQQRELISSTNLINPLLVDVLVRRVFADTTNKVVLQQATQTKQQKLLPLRGVTKARITKAAMLPVAIGLAEGIVSTVRSLLPTSRYLYSLKGSQLSSACHRVLRELRLAVCGDDDSTIAELHEYLLNSCHSMLQTSDAVKGDPLVHMVNNPFDPEWMVRLPPVRRCVLLSHLLNHTFFHLQQHPQAMQLASDTAFWVQLPPRAQRDMQFHLLLQLMQAGKLPLARQMIGQMEQTGGDGYDGGYSAWLALLSGQPQQALILFEQALKQFRRLSGKRTHFLPNTAGTFFILALLRQGDVASLNKAATYLDQAGRQWHENSFLTILFVALEALLDNLNGTPAETACRMLRRRIDEPSKLDGPIAPWFVAMVIYAINGKLPREHILAIDHHFKECRAAGLDWPALECAQLLCMADKETPERRQFIDNTTKATGIVPLCAGIVVEEPWRKGLRALQLAVEEDGGQTSASPSRIVYLLDFSRSGELDTITPLEQKLGAKGVWTKGRPIALQRLLSGDKLDGLTEADQGLRAAIRRVDHYYGNHNYEFNLRQALPALVGHPLLFLADSPTIPVEVVKGNPEILVVEQKGKMCIRFTPDCDGDERFVLVRETPTRYKLVELTAAHHRMARALGSKGLLLPASAKEEMSTVLSSLASLVPVHSTIPGTAHSISTVAADSQPRAHLLPHGEGLRLEIFVKPLGTGGPALKPGVGVPNLMADIDGRRCQAERDLRQEQQRTATLVRALPSLGGLEEMDGQWFAPQVEEALQLLLELREAQAGDAVVVEWPEGEKLKIGTTLSFTDMHLRLGSGQSWFEVDGELRIDDQRVLDMRQLLDLLSTTQHRFLPLGEGEFLVLSRELRKRLDELATYAERKGKKLQLHPLAALAMEEFTDQVGTLEASNQWRQRLESIREGMALTPQVPSTLKAKLRDYQVEGFQWLARLAHLGFGACLADDMGLGKTIQALAAILHCADKGPTLW